jgi:hypothetical protein
MFIREMKTTEAARRIPRHAGEFVAASVARKMMG